MKPIQPPKAARKLFEWFSGQANIDDLLGDLDELFLHHCKSKSPRKARFLYWRNVLSLCLSYALRKRKRDARYSHFSTSVVSLDMLHSYFKVAVRNLYQHKYFTVLNAFGLAIGMSIGLLLIAMYSYVRTYDTFHENGEHIYSIVTHRLSGVEDRHLASAPGLLAAKINEEYSGQVQAIEVRARFYGEVLAGNGRVPIGGYYCDDQFLEMFSFPLLSGKQDGILSKPNQVVLTERTALKLFGNSDIIGQTVELYEQGLFEVSGVLQDIPGNSHLMFDVLVSLASWKDQPIERVQEQWSEYPNQYVYVNLQHDNPGRLQSYLNKLSVNLNIHNPVQVTFSLQHLHDIATSDHYNAIGPKWELSGFIVFGAIALMILLPACFNYTNIAIARALKRSKEIGLRKTLGGMQRQIFFQFITETVVVCMIALIGGIACFIFMRSEFQRMMVAGSELDLSITPFMAFLFVAFAIFTGLVAGLFPAIYFSRLNPVEAIKSKLSTKTFNGMRVRKGLTIMQFSLSFCFILSIIVFGRQYRTLLNMDFGFRKENIVIIDLKGEVKPDVLMTELAKIPAIQSISFSSGMPVLTNNKTWIHLEKDSLEINQLFVNNDFLTQLNIQVLHGASFLETYTSHEQGVLVNEQLVRNSGLTVQDAIGHVIRVDSVDLPIVGIVQDFRHAPSSQPVGNFMLRYDPTRFSQVNAVIDVSNVFETFTSMEKSWKALSPDVPLQANFFENALDESFDTYKVLIKLAGFLGLLAISISILGLLGMVVFTVETRMKEVCIRKVMGASASTILVLLSKDFLKLLLFSVMLGIPMAVFIYQTVFTQIPNYHADLTVWDILAGTCGLFLLGIITITSQTYKTALTQPAEVLKTE
jgi:putative ABC transport system permease protein